MSKEATVSTAMRDRSTTFAINGDDVPRVVTTLADVGFDIGTRRSVTTALLDTFDGRLNRAGLRLEAREGDTCELVLTGDGVVPAHLEIAAAPRFAHELPAGPFRSRITAITDVRALLPRVRVAVTRLPATLRDLEGRVVAVAILHEGLSVVGHDVAGLPPATLQLDEVTGAHKAVRRAAREIDRLGLARLDTDTIAVIVRASGVDLGGFSGSPTVPLDPDMPAVDGFRDVLVNLARTIDANWQGTIDDVDPEFLHDLRVAVRRTRAVLAQGKSVLPGDVVPDAREWFAQLAGSTGPARDLDVYLIEWDGYTSALGPDAVAALAPVRRTIEQRRANARAALEGGMRSADAAGWVASWQERLAAISDHEPQGEHARRRLGRVVATRIARAHTELVAGGRLIRPETPAEQVHELRKEAKVLRYLVECFGSLLPVAPRKQFVQRLKSLQDNLGTHQDAEVHVAMIREIAGELHQRAAAADTLLAIGQLTERLDQIRAAARADFAERFATYDTRQTQRALDAMLGGITR